MFRNGWGSMVAFYHKENMEWLILNGEAEQFKFIKIYSYRTGDHIAARNRQDSIIKTNTKHK